MTALNPPFAPAPYPQAPQAPQQPQAAQWPTAPQPNGYAPVQPQAPPGYDPNQYAQPAQPAPTQPVPVFNPATGQWEYPPVQPQYAPQAPPQPQYAPAQPPVQNPFANGFGAPATPPAPIFGGGGDIGSVLGSIDWSNVPTFDTRLMPINHANGIPIYYEGEIVKAELGTDRSGGLMIITYVKPTFPLELAKEYAGVSIRNNSTTGEKAQGITKSWLIATGFLSSDGKQCLLRNVQDLVHKHVRFRIAYNENPKDSGQFFNQIAGGVVPAFETPGLSTPVAALGQASFGQPTPQAAQQPYIQPYSQPAAPQQPQAPTALQPPQVAPPPGFPAQPQAPAPVQAPQPPQFAAPIPPGVPNFGQG